MVGYVSSDHGRASPGVGVAPRSPTVRRVSRARRPRFLPFILTGAVIGFAVGGFLAVSGRFENTDSVLAQQSYDPSAAVGYLGLLGAGLFGLLGALVALAVESWSRRS